MPEFNGRVLTNKMDDYNTPKEGWEDILQFIDKTEPLWLPFYNDGTAKKIVNKLGYENVYHENKDFFTYYLDDRILIDNPPFSLKKEIIEICFKKGKKFALLLPFDTIERKYFKKWKNGLQIIVPNNRYKYIEGNSQPPFKSIWLCWNMKIRNNEQLIFL